MNKKITAYIGIVLFITAGIGASQPPQENPRWKNVRVIPKKTDEDQMERIMTKYTRQLGVTCLYCHPFTKPEIFPRRVDFVTEEKPEKIVTRNMMRMTDAINKKYFAYKNDYSAESLSNAKVITCNTCHRGLPKPTNLKLFHGN